MQKHVRNCAERRKQGRSQLVSAVFNLAKHGRELLLAVLRGDHLGADPLSDPVLVVVERAHIRERLLREENTVRRIYLVGSHRST